MCWLEIFGCVFIWVLIVAVIATVVSFVYKLTKALKEWRGFKAKYGIEFYDDSKDILRSQIPTRKEVIDCSSCELQDILQRIAKLELWRLGLKDF